MRMANCVSGLNFHDQQLPIKYIGQKTMTLVLLVFVIEFSVVLLFLILLKKYIFVRRKGQNQNNIKKRKGNAFKSTD
jgi:hypothetical protein